MKKSTLVFALFAALMSSTLPVQAAVAFDAPANVQENEKAVTARYAGCIEIGDFLILCFPD